MSDEIPTAESAELGKILVLVKDLFFSVKLGNELRGAGYSPIFAKSLEQFVALIEEHRPHLGIIDITGMADWEQVADIQERPDASATPLLFFGPHKDVEGLRAAKAAGATRVVSNSQLHGNLIPLVQRYARQ